MKIAAWTAMIIGLLSLLIGGITRAFFEKFLCGFGPGGLGPKSYIAFALLCILLSINFLLFHLAENRRQKKENR